MKLWQEERENDNKDIYLSSNLWRNCTPWFKKLDLPRKAIIIVQFKE